MKALKKIKAYVADNLQNLLTGMGIAGVDKSVSSHFVDLRLDYTEMEDAYSSDWLVGKICDLPPFDMTREWRTIIGDIDPNKKKKFELFEKKARVRRKFKEAMTWARIYGGAGIIINVDDGNAPEEPLDIKNIKKGSLKALVVSDRQYLHLGKLDHDPMSENYGYPETYRLAPSPVQIHHTRVIRFEGVALPLQSRRRNAYWGKSLIERLYSALRRAAEVQESIGTLIHEASIDIIKVPDLMDMVASEDTEQALQKRFAAAKLHKSINRMLLLDSDEEYITHKQTFAGLKDILEKYLSICAGAADIPITRLFGQSPAGMNSTGESDLRNYYDHLAARQEVELRPQIEYLDRILYVNLFGQEPEEEELEFEFDSLWQMSSKEKAEMESFRASRDETYLNNNIITEGIVARDLLDRGIYAGVDADYVEELERLSEIDLDNTETTGSGSSGATH